MLSRVHQIVARQSCVTGGSTTTRTRQDVSNKVTQQAFYRKATTLMEVRLTLIGHFMTSFCEIFTFWTTIGYSRTSFSPFKSNIIFQALKSRAWKSTKMLKFCLQITTVQKGLTTQERQNCKKKIIIITKMLKFCLQITTVQKGLTTQQRRNC